jgi:hypothetical protein
VWSSAARCRARRASRRSAMDLFLGEEGPKGPWYGRALARRHSIETIPLFDTVLVSFSSPL